MKRLNKSRALLCLSGGQDSVTCLLWAAQKYGAANIYTVAFAYGQKHAVELACAKNAARLLGAAKHYVLEIPALQQIGDSALLTSADVNASKDGLPASFVPARNIIFLSQAAALAYKLDCGNLITGVSEADYSGYPDCRGRTIKLLEKTLNTGMEANLKIITPLLRKNKAETWALAYQCRGAAGVELIREHTHTCYNGDRQARHEWGYGCAKCPACRLRQKGYAEFRAKTK